MSDPSGIVHAMQRIQMPKQLNPEDNQQALAPPDPPDLSESFQEFVRPLVERLPPRFRLTDLRDPLLIAAAVWNQFIATKGNVAWVVTDVAEMIEEFQERPVSPELWALLEALAARKSSSFRDDDRLVADLEVHREGADVRVTAGTMPTSPGMNAVLVPAYSARSGSAGRRRVGVKPDPFRS
jgi:hypothetical protein